MIYFITFCQAIWLGAFCLNALRRFQSKQSLKRFQLAINKLASDTLDAQLMAAHPVFKEGPKA